MVADVALYQGNAEAALEHYSRVVVEASEHRDITREVWATYYVAVINAVLRRPPEAASAHLALSGERTGPDHSAVLCRARLSEVSSAAKRCEGGSWRRHWKGH